MLSAALRFGSVLVVGASLTTFLLSGETEAAPPTALFTSDDAGLDNSKVPNIEELGFDSGSFFVFERPMVAADGTTWTALSRAIVDPGGFAVSVVLVGEGLDATAVVAGGAASPAGGPPLSLSFDSGLTATGEGIRITSAGDRVFRESVASDEHWRLFRFDAASETWSVALEKGDPVPGFPEQSFANSVRIGGLTSDDLIAIRTSDTVGPLPSAENDFNLIGDQIVAQTGVTAPPGQLDDPPAVLQGDFFTLGRFDVTEDGEHFTYDGNLDDVPMSRDRIFVYDGKVVIQEDALLDDHPVAVDSLRQDTTFLWHDGTWATTGDFQDNIDFIVINGEIVALEGDPVPGSRDETIGDVDSTKVFFGVVTRGPDEFAYIAETDFADPDQDTVIVYNNEQILVREGEPADLDGDGRADDAFIDGIQGNSLAFIGDQLFFTATIENSAGAPLGPALLFVDLPCLADANGDGELNILDFVAFQAAFTAGEPSADCNGDAALDVLDFICFQAEFLAGCP